MSSLHTSWCEISASALRKNAETLKARLKSHTKLGVVVKSDGYGHGLTIAASAFLRGGADWLIVNAIDEAIQLRRASIAAPIYVCGYVPEAAFERVIETHSRLVLFDFAAAKALSAIATSMHAKVAVHIKLETGTNRQGLELEEAVELGKLVRSLPGLELEGLTTHFADIEDSTNHAFAKKQIERFDAALKSFAETGLRVPVPHLANSAATLLYPETHAIMVRAGIAAYGLWPSKETYATALQRQADGVDAGAAMLEPAMTWRARIAQVKNVAAGSYVGYGRTYRTSAPARIAVLPLGYYEGYDRRLSNTAHVLVHGQRAPVRGRVCMNMCMVDVTHVPEAAAGSVATLLGRDGDEEISAEQLAGWMGTINYEVVSRIHPSVARVEVE
ncbi:MAG: alanine racemase [Deltaproteobacteria bacterium]|nr:alanine racemase [Deltaproteobacteria bacterium]